MVWPLLVRPGGKPVSLFTAYVCFLGSKVACREELPLGTRLAHIALAYGGGPEKFAPGLSWVNGESNDPVWQVSLVLASKPIALLQFYP